MPMKPDIVILDEAAEIMPAPPTTEIKPWIPWEELDLKKIIQADRRYDLFGTETDEDQDVPDLQKLLQSLWQWQWPQQYYIFWEEKTKQPIFWKEREWMYDWVVVTDVKTIGKNVVQYSINWISQYWLLDLKWQTWLPLIYIIPSEQQANPDQLEQQDPQQADPDDSENNQDQSEHQEKQNDGDQEEQHTNTEWSDTQEKSTDDSATDESTSAEEKTQDEWQSSHQKDSETPSESKPSWDENEDGEEWAEKIVKAGAKKVTPEELLTLPKQEFVLAKWNSTIINDDGTETPNASYHTVKIFDNTQSTSTTTWLYVHEGKIKYFYSNEDGRVWQKKHSTYDKDWCLYWIAKASW